MIVCNLRNIIWNRQVYQLAHWKVPEPNFAQAYYSISEAESFNL